MTKNPPAYNPKIALDIRRQLDDIEVVERRPFDYLAKTLAMSMSASLTNKVRKSFLKVIYEVESSKDLPYFELAQLWHWCRPYQNRQGRWFINDNAVKLIHQLLGILTPEQFEAAQDALQNTSQDATKSVSPSAEQSSVQRSAETTPRPKIIVAGLADINSHPLI